MLVIEEYLRYKETERFLESLIFSKPVPHFVSSKRENKTQNPFGLERVRSFLQASGSPHLKNKYIHIAGTSGKTSTAYFVAHLLQAHGCKAGLFTSPQICTSVDYFTINMKLPPVKEIIALVEQLKPFIDREYEQKGMGMISHFEFLLAAALRYFAIKQVDYVALEAGLGGRHDATNVIETAAVSLITNIGLDHTHILGKTLPEIAADKVGIIKNGCPLVTAEQKPVLLDLFKQEVHKYDADLQILGKDFWIENVRAEHTGTVFDYISDRHTYDSLTTSVCGTYQAKNAALAIRTLEILSEQNETRIDENVLRKGLSSITIPGRYENVQDNPPVLLDGAHNPDKITSFVSYLQDRFKRDEVIFVCGFSAGRQPEEMLRTLLEVSETFYLTRIITGHRESEEPVFLKSLLNSLSSLVRTHIALDPFTALDMAIEYAKKHDKVVCITGSLYLVSYLRQRWYPEHQMLQS